VKLKGSTTSDSDKAQAESIAKSKAPSQVVANEIAVRPTGEESTARKVEIDADKGIEKDLDAVLVSAKLDATILAARKLANLSDTTGPTPAKLCVVANAVVIC
jgi:hypothetical protein